MTWVNYASTVPGSAHTKVIDPHKMNDEKAPLVLPQYQKPRSWLKRDCCPCIPARYVLAVMSSIGFMNVYALRVNLSVAIVEMSNDTATLRNRSARVSKPYSDLWIVSFSDHTRQSGFESNLWLHYKTNYNIMVMYPKGEPAWLIQFVRNRPTHRAQC